LLTKSEEFPWIKEGILATEKVIEGIKNTVSSQNEILLTLDSMSSLSKLNINPRQPVVIKTMKL
jgi:hypothetical protein